MQPFYKVLNRREMEKAAWSLGLLAAQRGEDKAKRSLINAGYSPEEASALIKGYATKGEANYAFRRGVGGLAGAVLGGVYGERKLGPLGLVLGAHAGALGGSVIGAGTGALSAYNAPQRRAEEILKSRKSKKSRR